jgi:hypothetical protein
MKSYRIIYDLIEDVEKMIKGQIEPTFEERILGQAEVRMVIQGAALRQHRRLLRHQRPHPPRRQGAPEARRTRGLQGHDRPAAALQGRRPRGDRRASSAASTCRTTTTCRRATSSRPTRWSRWRWPEGRPSEPDAASPARRPRARPRHRPRTGGGGRGGGRGAARRPTDEGTRGGARARPAGSTRAARARPGLGRPPRALPRRALRLPAPRSRDRVPRGAAAAPSPRPRPDLACPGSPADRRRVTRRRPPPRPPRPSPDHDDPGRPP